MKNIFTFFAFALFLVPAGHAQNLSSCDSAFIRLYLSRDLSPQSVPCDTVVVMNARFYDKISQRYNYATDLNANFDSLSQTLRQEVGKFEDLNQQQENKIKALTMANTEYRRNIDELGGYLQRSIDNTKDALKNTKKLEKKYKRERWTYLGVGLLGGAAVGLVTGIILLK